MSGGAEAQIGSPASCGSRSLSPVQPGSRSRAKSRRIAPPTASPWVTNSLAPPVCSASSRSIASGTAGPMPTTKMRCRPARAVSISSVTPWIWPSVTSSTSQGPSAGSASTEASARLISVPPRSAARWSTHSCAACRLAGVVVHSARLRCRTSVPKRDSENWSPLRSDAMPWRSACCADCRLAPLIEPEQSISIFRRIGRLTGASVSGGAPGTTGIASSTGMRPALSAASGAARSPSDSPGSRSSTSTRSRSSQPGCASVTATLRPSPEGSTASAWLGEDSRARASGPCRRRSSSKGYSTVGETGATW